MAQVGREVGTSAGLTDSLGLVRMRWGGELALGGGGIFVQMSFKGKGLLHKGFG